MRVLVACEFSGIVRDAFLRRGHDAWSCDILPSTSCPDRHIQGDVLGLLHYGWDLLIAHPPCTHLAASGAKHYKTKIKDGKQKEALDFVRWIFNAPIPYIVVENPVGIISTEIRKFDQIIQPWEYGHQETKTTCLWIKNLPKLRPTRIVHPGKRVFTKSGKSLPAWYSNLSKKDRGKMRSVTYEGIADAMAEQWGDPNKNSKFKVRRFFA